MPPKPKTKQKQKSSIGRALIKQKVRNNKEFFAQHKETRHVHPTSAASVHEEASLKSITQQTDLADFMSRIEMNKVKYESRLCNVKVQSVDRAAGVLSEAERCQIKQAQQQNAHLLRIPRRPEWDEMTSKEELREKETAAFHEWRLQLEQLSTLDNITVTPYEKNPLVWQQLWRVVERSDVVVQIVDARNPLMFRCTDLEKYVKEVDPAKVNVLLVNKSDFLSEEQRQTWTNYFNDNNIFAVFFSALAASSQLGEDLPDLSEEEEEEEEKEKEESQQNGPDGDDLADNLECLNMKNELNTSYSSFTNDGCESSSDSSDDGEYESANSSLGDSEDIEDLSNDEEENCNSDSLHVPHNSTCTSHDTSSGDTPRPSSVSPSSKTDSQEVKPSSTCEPPEQLVTVSKLHDREELIAVLERVSPAPRLLQQHTTIGLVGYPNVGKSSTINCLMQGKRVTVSATPGKTKHFQTLYLTPELVLCDCPGLVFPGFVSTRQEMIIWGILPIDEIKRDYHGPVTLICNTLPPASLEAAYSIPLPAGDSRPATAEELLTSYSVTRSFMSARGRPDTSRAGRAILKDFMNGRLLYCIAPPTTDQLQYHTYTVQAPETVDDRDAEVNFAFGLLEEEKPAGGKRPRKPRVKKPKGYVEYTEDENGPVMIITKPWRNKERKQKAVKKNPNLNNPYAQYLW
ncbi:GTP binding domain [Trinorchestia longiramus]|nr:GTP binding domain [Trinorchestia longiramus]